MPFIVSDTRDRVTTITLNRPDKLNAFAGTMREDLAAALREAEGRVVVITGAGRAFCAGGDVEFMASLQKRGDIAAFRKLLDAGRDVILQIATMENPVIASVNGVAAGAGCNLALACDTRIVSDEASFAESFVRIGLVPDWGGTWFLPRLAGRGRAFELMATGRVIDAREAERIGIVDRIVPASRLREATEKLASSIAAGPPLALAMIKAAIAASDLRAQIEVETEHQLRAFQSKDASEGMTAFFEKRPAKFRGE